MKNLFRLSFIPRSTDFALLLLRLWFGLTLFFHYGWSKLMNYSQMSGNWADPLHVGHTLSFILTLFAEVVCSACVVLGIAVRFAAAVIAIQMAVIFFMLMHGAIKGGGELAFYYLGPALTIVFAGGGKYVLCKHSNDVGGGEAPKA